MCLFLVKSVISVNTDYRSFFREGNSENLTERSFKADMNAHIAKPIDVKTILAVFDQVFGVF